MEDFLKAIWGNGQGQAELRIIEQSGTVVPIFFDYPDRLAQLAAVAKEYKDANVFAGVLLRIRRSGKNEDTVPATSVIWADFDTKMFGGERMRTFYAVNSILVPPQIVVDSGHGFHAYWLLDGTLSKDLAQQVMRGIAHRHGGDAVGDPARVMRVPGTYNVKTTPAMLVRLVRYNPLERTRITDVLDYAEPEFHTAAVKKWLGNVHHSVNMKQMMNQDFPKGGRSEAVFGVVCAMVREGWSIEQVASAMMEYPFGRKAQEMSASNADKWIKRTYNSAVQAVNLEK